MTNTLYYTNLSGTFQAMADEVTPHIAEFYNDCYASWGMAGYCQPQLAYINWYDMLDPEPRVPYTVPLGSTLTGVSNSNLPTEVALVVSFQGDPLPGVPQSRRRGRIYLGGWPQNTFGASVGDAFPYWATSVVTACSDSAMVNLLNGPDATWVVHSPTANTYTEVTNGWVDNSADTQRRRSVPPTARNLFPPFG